jgi:Ran GTPase-activating protein (RanGAP) involved in mRNA processing and transport
MLSSYMRKHPLQYLKLYNSGVGDFAVKLISKALPMSRLTTLNIGANEVFPFGGSLSVLMAAVSQTPTLKHLNLD